MKKLYRVAFHDWEYPAVQWTEDFEARTPEEAKGYVNWYSECWQYAIYDGPELTAERLIPHMRRELH